MSTTECQLQLMLKRLRMEMVPTGGQTECDNDLNLQRTTGRCSVKVHLCDLILAFGRVVVFNTRDPGELCRSPSILQPSLFKLRTSRIVDLSQNLEVLCTSNYWMQVLVVVCVRRVVMSACLCLGSASKRCSPYFLLLSPLSRRSISIPDLPIFFCPLVCSSSSISMWDSRRRSVCLMFFFFFV